MARRKLISTQLRQLASDEPWPEVDEASLDEDTRQQYSDRKRAVDAYLAGEATLDEIARSTGVSPANTIRLATRCVQLHKDGRIWGYRALLKHQRVRSYNRQAPLKSDPTDHFTKSGRAGAFGQLLERYPALQKFIEDRFLKRDGRKNRVIYETKITTETLHRQFLDECRRQGIHEDEYPFSQSEKGLRSLYKYIQLLKQTHMIEYVRARGSSDDVRLLEGTGNGPSPIRPGRPFKTVELDGHLADINLTVEIPDPFGSKFVPIHKIWLLAIIDLYSDAVLGYHLSLNSVYNRYDVLRCILNSLTPPPYAPEVIDGLAIPTSGRVPNDTNPALYWTSWDEIKLDNAMAHRASASRRVLTNVLGCSIIRGRSRSAFKRPYIERFFGLLEEHSLHRSPGTTGSNPHDSRREGGEAFAVKHQITLDEIHQLLDYAIAEYNHTYKSPLYAHSPLEAITNYLSRNLDVILRKLPPDSQDGGVIVADRVEVIIRGNVLEGRRPYINYEYERYSNAVLARSPEMIGQKLIITPNPDDLRVIPAYHTNGAEFGYLTAHGMWGLVPHTLEMRKHIHRLIKQKKLAIAENQDPVTVYLEYLQKKAPHNRVAASKWDQAARASPKSIQSGGVTVNSDPKQPRTSSKRTSKTIQ